MPGYAGEQLVATGRGLIPLSNVPEAQLLKDQAMVEMHFSDGGILRLADDQTLLCPGERLAKAGVLRAGDLVVRKGRHVARDEASSGLPDAAVAIARGSDLHLPTAWDEELAYFLGWLVGDGSFSARGAVTIYGSEREIEELMPLHRSLITAWTGFEPKPSIQANGTRQLRVMRKSFVEYLSAMGVAQAKSADKVVPRAVLLAPEQCLTGFLRGLFDADGCVVNNLKKGTRYVGLGSKSVELLPTVQSLLLSLNIWGRIYCTSKEGKASFSYTRRDGTKVTYKGRGPSFDLRITGESLREFAAVVGFRLHRKGAALGALVDDHVFYRDRNEARLVQCLPSGRADAYVLPTTHGSCRVDGFASVPPHAGRRNRTAPK